MKLFLLGSTGFCPVLPSLPSFTGFHLLLHNLPIYLTYLSRFVLLWV